MPRREQNHSIQDGPSITPEAGIHILSKQLAKGRKLLERRPIQEDDYDAWVHATTELLAKAFGRGSPNIERFDGTTFVSVHTLGMDEAYYERQRATDLKKQLTHLKSIIELLETDIQLQKPPALAAPPGATENSVFVVRGHNRVAKEAVARFVVFGFA